MVRTGKRRLKNIRQKFPKNMQKKLVMLFMAVILAFLVLIGRILYINVVHGEEYKKIVLSQQQYDSRTIPYKRGDIVDRNGTTIATSERVYNVILDAKVLLANKERVYRTKEVLNQTFGIETDVIDSILEEKPDSTYNILKKQVSYEDAQKFEKIEEQSAKEKEEKDKISGVWLEEDYLRSYPYNSLASDMIGFVTSGNVGTGGIEQYYNEELNGTDGREYGYLDSDSVFEQTVKNPVNGNTVVSTIDVNLQTIVEKYIKEFNDQYKGEGDETFGSKNTAVMIMNPNNGEVLAMASYPNFDLNNPRDLSAYYSEETIKQMEEDGTKVERLQEIWRNFCVSDTFEPGSVMKPFTLAAGLETGKIKGDETYYCSGGLQIGSDYVHCHKRDGHGTQTVQDAIANSCNVAFMHMGEVIGAEEFCKYQRLFGFGEYTGIDLPGEAETSGLLFRPEDMKEIDLAVNSFGQSFNVTMTQIAAAFCSIVNGGDYYEPHVVKQIQDENGSVIKDIQPKLLKRTISKETAEKLKTYMNATMEYGTGKTADVEGYDIGAKTGTAQKLPRKDERYLLSFCGYAPQENPEVVVYVIVDEANVERQDVSKYVLELSQKIMAEAFPYLNITKSAQTDSTNE